LSTDSIVVKIIRIQIPSDYKLTICTEQQWRDYQITNSLSNQTLSNRGFKNTNSILKQFVWKMYVNTWNIKITMSRLDSTFSHFNTMFAPVDQERVTIPWLLCSETSLFRKFSNKKVALNPRKCSFRRANNVTISIFAAVFLSSCFSSFFPLFLSCLGGANPTLSLYLVGGEHSINHLKPKRLSQTVARLLMMTDSSG